MEKAGLAASRHGCTLEEWVPSSIRSPYCVAIVAEKLGLPSKNPSDSNPTTLFDLIAQYERTVHSQYIMSEVSQTIIHSAPCADQGGGSSMYVTVYCTYITFTVHTVQRTIQ